MNSELPLVTVTYYPTGVF